MHREDFGPWGSELPEGPFWRAVAMVGVLNATGELRGPARMPLVRDAVEFDTAEGPRREWTAVWALGQTASDCRAGRLPPAAEFAEAWNELASTIAVRLYLAEVFDNQAQLSGWFSQEAGIASYSPMPPVSVQATDWQWPMRFGFLADQRSRAFQDYLRRGLEESQVVRNLLRVASVEEENVFEWLLLPANLDTAASALDDSPVPVRTHCIVLMDPWDGRLERQHFDAVQILQARTAAKGIVQLRDAELRIYDLVYQLSHNLSIDVALQRAAKVMPFIWADASLIEMSRVGRYVDKLGSGLLRLPYALELGSEAWGLNLAPGPHPASEVGKRLRDKTLRPRMFDHESDGATWATRIQQAKVYMAPGYVGAANDRIDWPSEELDENRALQLTVRGTQESRPRHFRRSQYYEFEVWIGRSGEATFSGAAFPEDALPQDDDGYLLTVSFAAQGFLEEPQLRTVFLPRRGESDHCVFSVTTDEDQKWFEGRLAVAYQNRILQTYLVTGSVNGPGDAAAEPIQMRLEMNVQAGWAGLTGQKRIGASMVLNRQNGEKSGVALAGYNHLAFSLEGLDKAIDLLEGRIGQAKWDGDDYKGLRAKGTTDMLVYLAKQGHELVEGMRQYATKDPKGQAALAKLLAASHIQVLAARESAKLPIEFFYSYESPDDGATVCPDAETAIKEGHCPSCPAGPPEYLCPSGFWALRTVIEWHAFDASAAAEHDLGSQAFAIEDRRKPWRQQLWTAPPTVVLAASEKVDLVEAGSYESMLKSIAALAPTQEAADWPDWVAKIKQGSPSVLVLVPHTDKSKYDEAFLEVRGNPLAAGKIKAEHVVGPESGCRPVVLLIGCNTDNIDLPFRSFPVKFARAGAAIVVSTVSYLLGRHATHLAAALVEEIIGSRRTSTTFGELMLNLRREWLLKDAPPIALSLKAYGDARWRLF